MARCSAGLRKANAADAVRPFLGQEPDEQADIVGRIVDVGIHPHDHRALGCGNADIERRGRDLPGIVQKPNAGVVGRISCDHRSGPVVAYAVDHEHFQPFSRIIVGEDRIETGTDPLAFVAAGNDHRD